MNPSGRSIFVGGHQRSGTTLMQALAYPIRADAAGRYRTEWDERLKGWTRKRYGSLLESWGYTP